MIAARIFDDVSAGQRLPMLRKGPLTTAHLMRWSSAIENWHRIHYDLPFSIEHDKLPALLVNGSLKQQFMVQLLKDWAGDSGWLWKIKFQFREMNLVGETLDVWAEVTRLEAREAYGLAHLELGIRNEQGKESTPGSAVIALPYRNGPPLPRPFQPPCPKVAP